MDPKWHIAFLNISITQYADMTFAEYYSHPSRTLEAQLKAAEVVEKRFGVGQFIKPFVDTPTGMLPSLLGMRVVAPEEDELPAVDPRFPVIADVADVDCVCIGDPAANRIFALKRAACEYYTARGYPRSLSVGGAPVVTTACEVSANSLLWGLHENPGDARRLFDKVMDGHRVLAEAAAGGKTPPPCGYIGDDYAGLLSPAMFEEFVIPLYAKLYDGATYRFLHSELLHYDHLCIARDRLQIDDFHGAGAENLTLEEMHRAMGNRFWAQLTPHELIYLTPAQIDERIRAMADSGAHAVQLYPGRCTPDAHMDAAVTALQRHCTGGPR